jgi:hypothetical protein
MHSQNVSGRKPINSPKLRQARFEDYPAIVQLAGRYGLPPEPREHWVNLWLGNPAYTPGMPIGWVLDAGELVGWFANVPLHYEFNGDVVRTATPRSWVVDEGFRAFAVWLADAFVHQQNIDLLVSTTGNNSGSAGLVAVGAKPIPQQIKPEAAFWVTGYRGFAASYLKLKGISRSSAALALAAATCVYLVDAFRPSLSHIRTMRRGSEFGPDFDDFWRELRRIRGHMLLGRRDRAALDWHFGTALRDGRAWLFTRCEKRHMTSYAVFLRYDHTVLGLRRMILADFQQLEEDESALGAMLKSAYDESRRQGIHCIQILGSRLEASEPVQKLSPHKRPIPPESLPYLYLASGALEPQLRDGDCWDITVFDGDSSLCPTEIEHNHQSSSAIPRTIPPGDVFAGASTRQ